MRRAFWGLLVASIFSVLLVATKHSSALAIEVNAWESNFSLESSRSVSYIEVQNRYDCLYSPVKSISLKYPFSYLFQTIPVLLNPIITPLGNNCIVSNQNGLFTSEYIQGLGDSFTSSYYFGNDPSKMFDLSPTLPVNTWIDPAPEGEAVLFLVKQSASNKDYSVNAYNDIGDARPGIRNGKLTWEFGYQQPDLWKDKNSAEFKIDEHAFSPNGQYVAIHYKSTIAKVNLRTMEMTPVAYEPSLTANELAISNDGQYVALLKYNKLWVSDTANCETSYNRGAWDSVSGQLSYPGCKQSQDIIPKLVSAGLISSSKVYKRPYFSADSKKLNIGVGTRRTDIDTGGSTIPLAFNWQEMVVTANNHVSDVRGYLAMGDSFSSGEGDLQGGTWYEPGTDEQGNKDTFVGRNLCHLSRRSYPYLIAKELGYLSGDASEPSTPLDNDLFHSVACSGAVMHNVVGGARPLYTGLGGADDFKFTENQYANGFLGDLGRWQPGRIKQLDRLDTSIFGSYSSSEPRPEIITLGIGGNDAGFGDTILACALPGTCKQAVAGSTDASNLAIRLMNLKPKLVDTYKKLKSASPESRVYVHGYPVFVSGREDDPAGILDGGTCDVNVRLDHDERRLVVEGVKYMNQIVKSAAQEAGVVYIDVENILDGTNLCSGAEKPSMTVNGITAGNDKEHLALDILSKGICWIRSGCLGNESFHPNPEAHKLYSQRLLYATNSLSIMSPSPTPTTIPVPNIFFGSLAINESATKNNGGTSTTMVPNPRPFLNGTEQGLQIIQNGLLPGSMLRVELQSTPITVAQFTVPGSGEIDQPIILPEGAEPGAHELHIFGTDNFGTDFDYYEPIVVAFSDTDFDGDGVLDVVDSCITIFNSFVDADNDSIDDVCDSAIYIAPVPPEEIPPEVIIPVVDDPIVTEPPDTDPVPETPIENEEIPPPPLEEVPADQIPDTEKGQPNPETVAGDEEIGEPQVLGSSTTVQGVLGAVSTLANTGKESTGSLVVGLFLVLSAVVLIKSRNRG